MVGEVWSEGPHWNAGPPPSQVAQGERAQTQAAPAPLSRVKPAPRVWGWGENSHILSSPKTAVQPSSLRARLGLA